MQVTRSFLEMSDRYHFDCGACSHHNGYAQVDTAQDASYFGTWANPFQLKIVCFAEGDVTVQVAENANEFVVAMRELERWNNDAGYGCKVDGMCNPAIIAEFEKLGLGDMLH